MQRVGVSKSGYYKWRTTSPSERKKHREALAKEVETEYMESDRNYGSPKITEELRKKGFKVAVKTVGRIMKEEGLRSQAIGKFRVQTTIPITATRLRQIG